MRPLTLHFVVMFALALSFFPLFFFFFNDTATTEIYTLSLHDALPVSAEVDAEAPYRARLVEAIEAARRRGVRAEDLERARRRAIGGYLRIFNAPERIAGALLSLHLKDARLSDAVAALR